VYDEHRNLNGPKFGNDREGDFRGNYQITIASDYIVHDHYLHPSAAVKRLRLYRARYTLVARIIANKRQTMSRPSPTRSAPTALKLNEFLCFAIYSAGHAFNRAYQPLLRRLGLTYPQYLVMVALWENDEQTVGALGQKLSLESNTLTPLLKRLQVMGHLQRSRDLIDERQVLIRLTSTGRKLSQHALDIPDCILEASGLTAKDLQELLGKVAGLTKSLNRNNTSPSEIHARKRVAP
jgi:DNA-binding MarR family transcriptional regulator